MGSSGMARLRTLRAAAMASVVSVAALGCGVGRPAAPQAALGELRDKGRSSGDGEVVGRWALAEAFAPGGSADQAAAARRRLDALPHAGVWASLARGVLDEAHGDPRAATEAYVATLAAASTTGDASAPLVSWYAVRQLLALRASVAGLFAAHRPVFDDLLSRPGNLGWRAVADLEDWRAVEVYDKAEQTGDAYDDEVVARMGCARSVRLAGPFGHGTGAEHQRSFDPERPGPWPPAWAPDPMRGSVPHVLPVSQRRCLATADEQVPEGVFYAEAFFVSPGERDLIVAVQGAVAVWLDGVQVLSRGVEQWGSWQRFGARVTVGPGRHRVIARTASPVTSVRLLSPDGRSAGLETGGDPRAPYAMAPPRVLPDPNPLHDAVDAASRGGSAAGTAIEVALAAYAAHVDSMDDVASTLIEPLVSPTDAAPLALQMAAAFAAGDPAFPEDARSPRSRALRDRALAGDGKLWRARLAAVLDRGEQQGPGESVDALRELATENPGEPEVLEQLASVYRRLGWQSEQIRTLADSTARFADDPSALRAYLEALDEDGPAAQADAVAARLEKLDPDAEVALDRALARHDYRTATAELGRIGKRHPDRKEIASRLADVLSRSGDTEAAARQLEKALAKHPMDAQARFQLADRAYAAGDTAALRRALATALQAGADADDLRAAIDLLEGATDLEPYRRDGLSIVHEFSQWEKAGHHMDGTAARVLDYAAIVVTSDGSSLMLEHEIQKMQSQEAVHAEAEAEPPAGLVLHMRVIKPDRRA
jgi:tetratricopeptide (TPR) repeat protein